MDHMQPESERRQGERRRSDVATALQQAEAKFSTVFRVCPDLIAITAKATGRFLDVNDAFERIMGFSKAEAIGRTSQELGTWASPTERERMLAELGASGRLENFEVGFRRKGGEVFTALMSLEAAHLDGEDCLIIVARDISERKRDEMMLRQVAADLERSNSELERFAYVAAHDLQEPCRTICSFSQLLKRRYEHVLDKDGLECLDFLAQGAQRMQDLIKGVLSYSRAGLSAVALSETDLDDLLAAVVQDLAGALEATGGDIQLGPMPRLRGDPAQLRQLFINLISNGLKFQPQGRSPRVSVSAHQRPDCWEIIVADNGIGIEPEYSERIFAPFSRLHGPDRYPGAGIGLSVARRIVESNGGTIGVSSTPGEGSAFTITLPL